MTRTQTLPLGARIKAARKRAGLSHDRLGALVGTSRQHLIRLEKGTHTPRPDMLTRIAEATGATFKELDAPSEDDEESSQVRSMSLDDLLRLRAREILAEELGSVRAEWQAARP